MGIYFIDNMGGKHPERTTTQVPGVVETLRKMRFQERLFHLKTKR